MNRFKVVCFVVVFLLLSLLVTECRAFSFDDARHIISLLKERKFKRIESILDKVEKNYQKDFRKEREAYITWKSFGFSQDSLEPYFNDWIKERPQSPHAYLARSVYYSEKGWALRGERYASETSKEQFAKMDENLTKAYQDANKALELNPKIMQAYIIIVNVMMGRGGDPRQIVDKALQLNPYSLYIRSAYLKGLLPRWGGSEDEMKDFIRTIRPYYEKNPQLRTLEGRLVIEKGDGYFYNNECAQALRYYKKAVSFGDSTLAYIKQGNALRRLNRYPDAVASYDNALNIDPFLEPALVGRGESFYYLKNLRSAQRDAQEAVELNPFSARAVNLMGMILDAQGRYEEALRDYQRATELDPKYSGYKDNLEAVKKKMSSKKR